MAAHAYTRATYTNISRTHFTWPGERADEGKAWNEFMVVEAYRSQDQEAVLSFKNHAAPDSAERLLMAF